MNSTIPKDLTGKTFGKLVAIRRVNNPNVSTHKSGYWLCRCVCGKEILVRSGYLYKKIGGCGCSQTKISNNNNPKGAPKNKELNIESIINWLYNNYKIGAEKRNISFNLSKEDIKIFFESNCYYCGSIATNNNRGFKYNGIDRVDNNKGYEIENCVPCCNKCNKMKSKLSKESFLNHVTSIYKHINGIS